jgi:putative membrane protein
MDNGLIVLQSLVSGFPVLLLHFAVTLALWLLCLSLYYRLTPHNELKLVREGNIATAISSGGVAMGLALPLAFCLSGSVSVWDIIIWSIPILLIQIATFYILGKVLGDMPHRLENNEIAAAIYLLMVRMGSAFLVTAAIAG